MTPKRRRKKAAAANLFVFDRFSTIQPPTICCSSNSVSSLFFAFLLVLLFFTFISRCLVFFLLSAFIFSSETKVKLTSAPNYEWELSGTKHNDNRFVTSRLLVGVRPSIEAAELTRSSDQITPKLRFFQWRRCSKDTEFGHGVDEFKHDRLILRS